MGGDELVVQQDVDRASRIAARCKRIQEKLAAVLQGDSSGAQGEVAQQQGTTRTMHQLLQSSKRLLKLKFETHQAVTAVKVQGDEQESLRRQKDERMRQDLRAALLAEAEAAASANSTISGRWAGVLSHNVPQDMFNAIEQQRMACEAVIACKDRLIADIRTALKAKDEEYVKLLKRQAADVDAMLSAMGQQLGQMTAAYREELQNVEGVLLQERAELLASNRKEVGSLLEARAAAESNFTDKYLAAVETYAQNLEQLRHADAEEYQVLKIKLESDISVLEQHLETMRATYQLNAEKLEYNYRVLLERDAENTSTINQQKRKLSRQHDVLLNLKGKYSRSDGKACDENSKLTEEYKRITEHFKDMQAKFCHFGRVDMAMYNQLWQMQQQEACSLVQQLLAADRVIHEQQLGWRWQPPDESLFVSPHDVLPQANCNGSPRTAAAGAAAACASVSSSSPKAGCGAGSSVCGGSRGGSLCGAGGGVLVVGSPSAGSSRQTSSSGCHVALGSPTAGNSLSGSGGGRNRRGSSATGAGSQRGASTSGATAGVQLHSPAEVVQRLTAPNYYGALCLLVDEAGFLVESKTAALLAELPANEAKLVAAESIVRALGVTDGPSFDALMDALSDSAGAVGGNSSNAGGVSVLVHPSDALLRLKQFVEAESGITHPSSSTAAAAASGVGVSSTTTNPSSTSTSSSKGPRMLSSSSQSSGGPKSPNSTAAAAAAAATAAGLMPGCFQGQVVSRRADREREFWERLTKAVGDRVVRVWAKLEQQLGSYHKLLVARGEGLAAISRLQQENEELRGLLNQYLGSKINSELQIPPMALVL